MDTLDVAALLRLRELFRDPNESVEFKIMDSEGNWVVSANVPSTRMRLVPNLLHYQNVEQINFPCIEREFTAVYLGIFWQGSLLKMVPLVAEVFVQPDQQVCFAPGDLTA